ncbi:MAG: helix-turn-helix domain-containing protein [Candidatus Sulfotelmatobacter sp.]
MSDLLTVSEVAEILGVGYDTVVRRFSKVKGVIDLGSPETPKRRRYRVLRIPKSVIEKFLLARGGSVDIETPARPPKASKKKVSNTPPTEDELVRQLATITKQHGAETQKTLDKIAERARLLAAHVPEDRWSEIVWFDDEG